MAKDMLNAVKDRLWQWLSSDPGFILNHCERILFMNEYREIERQSSALEKMQLLLKIIIEKGDDSCQSFVDILRIHQAHYWQLQQFFKPNTQGSSSPTVVADGGSVVTAREMENIRAKSINMKIETVSGAGGSQCGNSTGQNPQADYIATGGSVICADKICNTSTDGDFNLSVTVKASTQVCPGLVDETLPSSQEPAVKMIRQHKEKLVDCLRSDCSFILQRAQVKELVTDRQYQNLKDISQSEQTVIDLIDRLMSNGQKSCTLFIEVLKEPEVLRTYPQLKDISWC
ncbi:uncharacterized protein LOC113172764 [Anabas testudineus]|uniref:uncharacterized protein LOC113172764 n=1 Tax=Anabas testudineus TaxID=64144 RepID=UPI000E455901|nr:uncharacterized protein LOC113172764 [Anabas testudineus]